MNTDALKELLKIYTQLPSGVLVFKDSELSFINNHLRNIVTLGNLPMNDCLKTLTSMLNIPSSNESLLNFFTNNTFFSYKTKHIQISYNKYKEYEIFVFTRLDASVLEEIFINFKEATKIIMKDIEVPTYKLEEEKEDTEILEYFEKNRNVKTTGYVLYKGVPLISENIVLQIYKNLLAVKIEDKQMICSKIGALWIIKTNEGIIFQAVVKNTNNAKKLIFLSTPKIIQNGFDKRECIRYKLNPKLPLVISLANKQATLYAIEVSENSLKALTDNATVLENISKSEDIIHATMQINEQTISLSCKFFREGDRYDQKAEIILLFTLDINSNSILNKWLNEQQIKVIREVQTFKYNSTLSK
jgi:hypothetical protein